MHEIADQIFAYVRAAWRYRWFAIVLAWVIALYGWFTVYRMPDRFEATARVWVSTQSVIKHFTSGVTAQPNVSQLVGSIGRTLVSRPNMERLIRIADIDIGFKTPEEREQLINRLTKELTIQSPGGDLYFATFPDTDPERAKRVVQSLITIFEERSRSDQRRDVDAAQRFLEEELRRSKEKLDAAEKVAIEMKRKQILGGGGGSYAGVMEAQAALNEAMLELKIAESNRDALKRSLADETEIPTLIETPTMLGDSGSEIGARSEIDVRILALEQKLEGLRVSYTEQHPDIVAIVRVITQLKEQQQKAEAQLRKPTPRGQEKAEVQPRRPVRSAAQSQLKLPLAAAEANVAAVRARVEEYRKRYDGLRAAAFAAPEFDAELSRINREYDMAKSNYAHWLARLESALLSNELETRTNVTDFRVVDPPRVVRKGPNRPLLNTLVLVMALGGGCAFAFGPSQIRPTFTDERRLRDASGVQVIGSIAMEWTGAQKSKVSRGLAALFISVAGLLSAYAAILVALTLTASKA